MTDICADPGSSVYYQVLNSSGVFLNCDANTGMSSQNSPVVATRADMGAGIGRLDYVVSAAEAKGVKLVVPLLNNFDDLGGINTYTNAFVSPRKARSTSFPHPIPWHDLFAQNISRCHGSI